MLHGAFAKKKLFSQFLKVFFVFGRFRQILVVALFPISLIVVFLRIILRVTVILRDLFCGSLRLIGFRARRSSSSFLSFHNLRFADTEFLIEVIIIYWQIEAGAELCQYVDFGCRIKVFFSGKQNLPPVVSMPMRANMSAAS